MYRMKKLIATMFFAVFAAGGFLALGAAEASTAQAGTTTMAASMAGPKMCLYRTRHVTSALNVRKIRKHGPGRVIGKIFPHHPAIGACKMHHGWRVVVAHKPRPTKKHATVGVSSAHYLKKLGRLKK